MKRTLTDLPATARSSGIDVRGGWVVRDDAAPHDFGVENYRVVDDGRTEPESTTYRPSVVSIHQPVDRRR